MGEKKKTSMGTLLAVIFVGTLIVIIGALIIDVPMDSPRKAPAQQTTVTKPIVKQPTENEWIQPRIYPGVELYYQHNNQSPMLFIGTIVDAVGYGSGDERTFSIRYNKTGKVEYKYRRILWNGCWYVDREQMNNVIKDY